MITVAVSSHWTISVGGARWQLLQRQQKSSSTDTKHMLPVLLFILFSFLFFKKNKKKIKIKLQKVSCETFRQRRAQWTNYPQKLKEDLDDNDAGAIITDVWTGGVLLAKQYVRASLIIPALTYILSPEELAAERRWCSGTTQHNTTQHTQHNTTHSHTVISVR